MLPHQVSQSITIEFEKAEYEVQFNLGFCLGKRSTEASEYERLVFRDPYDIKTFLLGDDKKAYTVIADEGVLLTRVSDVSVRSKDEDENRRWDFGIAVSIHTKKPEFDEFRPDCTDPVNEDSRDGVMWCIPKDHNGICFDQNGLGKYQIVVKRACQADDEPKEDEEVTTDATGVVYLLFALRRVSKAALESGCEERTRGVSRKTRSVLSSDGVQARVGYGDQANTSSTKSRYEHVPGTGRLLFPIRYLVRHGSGVSEAPCSETASKACKRVHMDSLQEQLVEMPL